MVPVDDEEEEIKERKINIKYTLTINEIYKK